MPTQTRFSLEFISITEGSIGSWLQKIHCSYQLFCVKFQLQIGLVNAVIWIEKFSGIVEKTESGTMTMTTMKSLTEGG